MKSALTLALVLGLIGFLPLMGGPRYEAALVAGLIAPLWAGLRASRKVLRDCLSFREGAGVDGHSTRYRVRRFVVYALMNASIHAFAVVCVALLHGLRTGFCEPWEGFALLLLGPCLGIVLASICGSAIGLLTATYCPRTTSTRRLRVISLLGLVALILTSALYRLWGFYSSPKVFAYDSYVGYFSGPLYDTVVYDLNRLLSFRVGTVFTIVSICGIMTNLVLKNTKHNRLRLSLLRTTTIDRWVLASAFVCGFGSVICEARATNWGHTQTTESIQDALGRRTTSGPCTVYFPKNVGIDTARLTADECVGHLIQLGRYFGIKPVEHVDIYLFGSSAQKRYYMGAADTYIAKPWRREIYLQPAGFPHPVLGHELAHVVTGQFGQGPLKVAGSLGGLLPDPGRIEGFAVAASPKEHSEGTLHQWAAAMRTLELLPPLDQLFQLGFLSGSAARSYGAAGSFVDYIHQTHGPEVLKRWYGGESLPALTTATFGQLEQGWHGMLDDLELPDNVLQIAKPRFSRPGVFERKCPHAVDRALDGFHSTCTVQENKARRYASLVVELDPTLADLELQLPLCARSTGDEPRALQEAEAGLSHPSRYSPGARRAAYEFIGDTHWAAGRSQEAQKYYQHAQALTYRLVRRRQLELKLWALKQLPQVQGPLQLLFAPSLQETRVAVLALDRMVERDVESDLAAYLLGRRFLKEGSLSEAQEYLGSMDLKKLPLVSLRREGARMQLLLACRLTMKGAARTLLDKAAATYSRLKWSEAQLLEALRVVERCEVAAARKTSRPISKND